MTLFFSRKEAKKRKKNGLAVLMDWGG